MIGSLANQGQNHSTDQKLIDLVDELTRRFQAGESLDLEALTAAHPQYAEQLRTCLPTMRALAELAGSVDSAGAIHHADDGPLCGMLGDFRILGELGRGGMGVVYEAQQISLGRRVAIKVLPFASMLDERSLKRFRNEAQAAALIDHPHIVDIYAVGCERGMHFYAMRLIDGPTLAEVIGELQIEKRQATRPQSDPSISNLKSQISESPNSNEPTTDHNPQSAIPNPQWETVARAADATTQSAIRNSKSAIPTGKAFYRFVAQLGIDVAEALDHAHEQGVIHRDIKPSNLMLDRHGKVWITDFGLAHIEANASMTHTGDLLGTLRYMSPEQAAGKPTFIDHRADVYSLGATLYELLTLKPVFDGPDRQELLRQLSMDEPRRLRQAVSTIPIELETIVLKSLEKSPADRYTTAQELADDLRRFLADRPIVARPPRWHERMAKWTRRHRQLAAISILFVFLTGIGSAAAAGWIWWQNARLETALRKTEEKRAFARKAVDELFTKISSDPVLLRSEPGTQQLRRQLLERAKTYYEQFLEEDKNDPELRYQTAFSYLRLAAISGEVDPGKQTLDLYRQAVALLESVWRERQADEVLSRDLAYACVQAANAFDAQGERSSDALYLHQAQQLLEALHRRNSDDMHVAYGLAQLYLTLGGRARDTDRFDDALSWLEKSRELQQHLYEKYPANLDQSDQLAGLFTTIGQTHLRLVHTAAAVDAFQKALAIRETMAEHDPKYAPGQLAWSYSRVAAQLNQGDTRRAALSLYQRAQAIFAKLWQENPDLPGHLENLIKMDINLANVQEALGQRDDAIANLEAAVVLARRLTGQFPDSAPFAETRIITGRRLADLLAAAKRAPEAQAGYDETCRFGEQALQSKEDAVSLRGELGLCYSQLGVLFWKPETLAQAHAAMQRAGDLLQTVWNAGSNYEWGIHLANTCNNLGIMTRDMGRLEESQMHSQNALGIYESIHEQHPLRNDCTIHLGGAYCNMGLLMRDLGWAEQGLSWFQKAIALLAPLAKAEPKALSFLRKSYGNRRETLESLSRFDEAVACFDRLMELDENKQNLYWRMGRAHCLARATRSAEAIAEVRAISMLNPSGLASFHLARICGTAAAQAEPAGADQDGYGNLAMKLLHNARSLGHFQSAKQLQELETDPCFAPLRARDDYRRLVAELAQSPPGGGGINPGD